MPILSIEHIIERLERRISELESGTELANRDIRALLTEEQQRALDAALAAQALLKKGKRARTEEEKVALGWKTIREVRLEIMKAALAEANNGLLEDFERQQKAAEVRQARIYFKAVEQGLKSGKNLEAAKTWANNELTRAGLARMDMQRVERTALRDELVWEIEETLRAQFKAETSEDELGQQQLLDKANKQKKSY